MNYTAYDQTLLGQVWFYIVLGLLGAGLSIGAFLYRRHEQKKKGDQDKTLISLPGVAAVLIALFFLGKSVTTVYQTAYDINHQAYITYEGTFEVEHKKNADWLTFTDGDKTLTLGWEAKDLSSGTYDGKILYAEKTGIVLQVWVYDRL